MYDYLLFLVLSVKLKLERKSYIYSEWSTNNQIKCVFCIFVHLYRFYSWYY